MDGFEEIHGPPISPVLRDALERCFTQARYPGWTVAGIMHAQGNQWEAQLRRGEDLLCVRIVFCFMGVPGSDRTLPDGGLFVRATMEAREVDPAEHEQRLVDEFDAASRRRACGGTDARDHDAEAENPWDGPR